jgi:hypothetical protein
MDIRPSQKLYNHSSEFNWGYNGSSPAQLALALLYDVSGDRMKAVRYHQEFKHEFVASWQDEWTITADVIANWLSSMGD